MSKNNTVRKIRINPVKRPGSVPVASDRLREAQ